MNQPKPNCSAGPEVYGPPLRPRAKLHTHEVVNQAEPLADVNLFERYPALKELVVAQNAEWALPRLEMFGAVAGSGRLLELGAISNRDVPRLRQRDIYGRRINEIEFSPAHHEVMSTYTAHELGTLSWNDQRPGSHVAHMGLQLLGFAAEAGAMCPMAMGFAAPALLELVPSLDKEWRHLVLSKEYDGRFVPHTQKTWAAVGFNMTEKQGGSDLRRVQTVARPVSKSGSGEAHILTGHKWYCSAIQADAFVTLARTEAGPTAFFVPRWLPDGTRNTFDILALKEKMGNRSNPTGEMEFNDTWAIQIGEEGQGIKTCMRFLKYSRLGFAVTPAGLMRQALVYAIHFARGREAFGAKIIDKPLHQNVLADMALESEAATALVLRIARAYDEERAGNTQASGFARISVALAKYFLNKRAMGYLGEAMECLGAQGYCEDSPMPRFYRELHFSCIGEGPGNVICLDVMRAMRTTPDSYRAFIAELQDASSSEPRLRAVTAQLADVRIEDVSERDARTLVETMSAALEASLLVRYAPSFVADAFIESRLVPKQGFSFGTLPKGNSDRQIIDRAFPA